MKKFICLVMCLAALFICGCSSTDIPLSDYQANLEKNGLVCETMSQSKLNELIAEFNVQIPEISIPSNVMLSGNFSEALDIDAYIKGEKEFDAAKFSEEIQGCIIDFGSSLKSEIAFGFKEDLLNLASSYGIELTDDIKFEKKGSYIYIGYEAFMNATYEYTPTTPAN